MTAAPSPTPRGATGAEIDVRDLDTGNPIKLADLKGKVVVLDFWGYWCGPCIGSMPELIKVHDQFKDRPVVILAIHDQSVQSREAYDRKLEGIPKQKRLGRAANCRSRVAARFA